MSWHFSRALVEEYSAGNFSDGEPCALLSGSPTPLLFCASAKTMEFFSRSRCGMTFAPSTDGLGAGLLMWFLAGFHAPTLAPQDGGQELMASTPDSGWKWPGSLARYDRDSSMWRTRQCSLLGDWDEYSETWPRWGLMRDGELLGETISEPQTSESESGYWPTPKHGPIDASCTMETALKWADKSQQDNLSYAVAKAEHQEGRHMPHGQLNPTWVEWLMGWPIGWTDLEPLAMDRFQEWWRLHGGF